MTAVNQNQSDVIIIEHRAPPGSRVSPKDTERLSGCVGMCGRSLLSTQIFVKKKKVDSGCECIFVWQNELADLHKVQLMIIIICG